MDQYRIDSGESGRTQGSLPPLSIHAHTAVKLTLHLAIAQYLHHQYIQYTSPYLTIAHNQLPSGQ